MMIDKILRPFRSRINAMITERIVTFYLHLVKNGSIKPLPTDGPLAN